MGGCYRTLHPLSCGVLFIKITQAEKFPLDKGRKLCYNESVPVWTGRNIQKGR